MLTALAIIAFTHGALTAAPATTSAPATAPALSPAPADDCTGQACVRTGAAQLFALADKLFAQGDLAGAAQILEAITQDKHLEIRSEARFRLAAVREKQGDLAGAA